MPPDGLSQLSFLGGLLAGFASSLHCVGMCGGIAASLSVSLGGEEENSLALALSHEEHPRPPTDTAVWVPGASPFQPDPELPGESIDPVGLAPVADAISDMLEQRVGLLVQGWRLALAVARG